MLTFEQIEKEQGLIYHELGHVFGYCLSNQFSSFSLGRIKLLEIGTSNCVTPKNTIYHFENPLKQKDDVFTNTSNIERTFAWFIEVISGCTFQSIFENRKFKDCFVPKNSSDRFQDFCNMSVIRNFSAFSWTFDNIYKLQSDYQKILKQNNIIPLISPIVDELKITLKNHPRNQLEFYGDELEKLVNEIDILIPIVVIKEYYDLIQKYKLEVN